MSASPIMAKTVTDEAGELNALYQPNLEMTVLFAFFYRLTNLIILTLI